jgi:osmotically-inducible protein OsmY
MDMRGRAWCAGALGALLMYLFDPDRGRYRRGLLRDTLQKRVRHVERVSANRVVYALNRTRGMLSQGRAQLAPTSVPDDILRDRVRARLGHVVRHAHAIQVTAENGCVRLEGHVLPNEADAVKAAMRHVPGIVLLECQLDERGWIGPQSTRPLPLTA